MTKGIASMGLAFAAGVIPLLAHDQKPPQIPAGEVAMIRPPAAGSEAFARALASAWQGLIHADRMEDLKRISDDVGWLEDANKSPVPEVGPREIEWLRWRVSENAKALADSVSGLQTLDFTSKGFVESELLEIDPKVGVMMLKVVMGDGPAEFATKTLDFTSERDPANYTIEVGEKGTTYVLLKLEDVPAGESELPLQVQRAQHLPVHDEIPDVGRVRGERLDDAVGVRLFEHVAKSLNFSEGLL